MSGAVDPQTAEKRWIHRDNMRAWVAVAITVPVSFALYFGIVILIDQPLDQLTATFISGTCSVSLMRC